MTVVCDETDGVPEPVEHADAFTDSPMDAAQHGRRMRGGRWAADDTDRS